MHRAMSMLKEDVVNTGHRLQTLLDILSDTQGFRRRSYSSKAAGLELHPGV